MSTSISDLATDLRAMIEAQHNGKPLPASLQGKLREVEAILGQADETEFSFIRRFNYLPFDGAAAFQRALARKFGTMGTGVVTETFFGDKPPEYRTVRTGISETVDVPWGKVMVSQIKAVFTLTVSDSKRGYIFAISVKAPRKYRAVIDEFLDLVQEELDRRSIYRGKAIDVSDCEELDDEPTFIDLSVHDPDKIVYAQKVSDQLEANLFAVIRYSSQLRNAGQPLKRGILLTGPYGTGKTSTGGLTARLAVEHGWTFIRTGAGQDPHDALRMASLYSPAVALCEDVDVHLGHQDREEMARILDTLDSVQNKGAEVILVLTTNFPERIERAALRPRRIDAVVEFGGLDEAGYQQLIVANLPAGALADDIDWPKTAAAFAEFYPSFAVEAAGRAYRYSLVRGGGQPQLVTTEDLVVAADGLRPQLVLMDNAPETRAFEPGSNFAKIFARMIEASVMQALRKVSIAGMDVEVREMKRK